MYRHQLCCINAKINNIKTEDLTPEELSRLIKVLDDEQDIQASNMARIALYTGMRRGELFSLKWSDVNFRRKTITIRDPKGGLDVTIPLNKMAEKVLKEHPDTGSEFFPPEREVSCAKKHLAP